MKQKKDRLFVVIMGLTLANLVFYFSGTAVAVLSELANMKLWAVLIANGMAILGILWLLRAYKKGRKIAKAQETQEKATD